MLFILWFWSVLPPVLFFPDQKGKIMGLSACLVWLYYMSCSDISICSFIRKIFGSNSIALCYSLSSMAQAYRSVQVCGNSLYSCLVCDVCFFSVIYKRYACKA